MKLYESDEQMNAWDFIENKNIDVIENDDDINQEVSYICPKCQKKYKEKTNAFYKKECEECRKNDIVYYLSGKWKYQHYTKEALNWLLIIVFSIFSSVITVELEALDVQFAYMTVCYTVFFFGVYMLLSQYLQSRFLKNPEYQRFCLTTFLLLKNEDIFSLTQQINLSLAGIIRQNLQLNCLNENIVYKIKTDNKYFCKLLNKNREAKSLGKLIKNDMYYNQMVSEFETKSMINFKAENKILYTALEFLITFIGIFLTVVNYISNWERFGWKSLTIFIALAVLLFLIIIPLIKFHERNKIQATKMRLIVVSSAIAKKYNQDKEEREKLLEENK